MLQDASGNSRLSGVGDCFVVKMHNDEMGDYEITNHVVEFEEDRLLTWEPVLSGASRPEDVADIGKRAEHRWSFALAPDGPSTTVVTETFDCSRSPEWLRRAVKGGNRWVEAMTATLERLDLATTK
jgi:hypothetical protein